MRSGVISSLAVLCLLLLWTAVVQAKIPDGVACAYCHTMHNSQDGNPMAAGTGGPIVGLLVNTCIGCHSGTNPDASSMAAPKVVDDSGVGLAGGNFYSMSLGETAGDHIKGHNIAGLNDQDTTHGLTPPGGSALSAQLVCAGTYGCHGDTTVNNEAAAMHGTHHDAASPIITGYRHLKDIVGLEAADWEYNPTANSHNQYKANTGGPPGTSTDTITSICERCHGTNFHTVAGVGSASPWLRHPSDVSLPASTEYASYNKGGAVAGEYNTIVPVASSTGLTLITSPSGTDAIITCITCHRAHASDYASSMRWDYKNWPASGYAGCQVCHSTKD